VLFLSLEHPLLKIPNLLELLRIYHENIHPAGSPTLLLLDEVHYSPDWDVSLKTLVDHHPEYRILATGSATLATRKALAESGAGRWVTVSIPTLSFYEFIRVREEPVPELPAGLSPRTLFEMDVPDRSGVSASLRPLLPLFQRYLLLGGFPETARLDDVPLSQQLLREDVVDRVLKRDLTALFGVRNVQELERLFIYLCYHTGGIFQAATCAGELGLNANTVTNHLDHLEQAHLVYRLNPFGLGGKQILKPRQKVHLVDAALRNAILMRPETVLQHPGEMGMIVESTVLRHIIAYQMRQSFEVAYWRQAKGNKETGPEVDIVLSTPGQTVPFEVKYRESASMDADSGLARFCASEGLDRGYLVTKSERDFGVTTLAKQNGRFLKVPAHIFAFITGRAEHGDTL
jgi:predicted AAA+ superfamily ATPase